MKYCYDLFFVIYFVNDPIISDRNTISISPGELNISRRERVISKSTNGIAEAFVRSSTYGATLSVLAVGSLYCSSLLLLFDFQERLFKWYS